MSIRPKSTKKHDPWLEIHTYTWGIDLSGSLQGVGGVGGLLMVSEISNSQISNYYPTYDGNGNISEYLDSTGAIAAHYEYDPFGKTTVATGSKSNDFAHRFSTKPMDVTTGLYYYGYRWYDPEIGRWPSRDFVEEHGGVNIYGVMANNPINLLEYLGLFYTVGEELKFERPYLEGGGGTIWIKEGNYGIYVDDEIASNNDDIIAAAEDHEWGHVRSAQASTNANAIPYKQVYCIDPNGKPQNRYPVKIKASDELDYLTFRDGDQFFWHYMSKIRYSSFGERNIDEVREHKKEIESLSKSNSPGAKNRVERTLKPSLENFETGPKSKEKGSTGEWNALKVFIAAEKAAAVSGNYNFVWLKPETIYAEIR